LHKLIAFFAGFFKLVGFASTASGLRSWNVAAFASLKKFAAHFFNPALGGTDPKEAAYPATVFNSKNGLNSKIIFK
jgi:hypothetical protein